MSRKLRRLLLVFPLLVPILVTAQFPYVYIAYDYLAFNLDARIAGSGGISVVAPHNAPDAGTKTNPALMLSDQRYFTLSSNTSTLTWLSDNMYLGTELAGSWAFNNNNALGFSVSYLDHGSKYFLDQGSPYGIVSARYFDLFAKLSYAHSFGKGITVGGSFKYSRSDYNDLEMAKGSPVKDLNGLSVDIGFNYYKVYPLSEKFDLGLDAGLAATTLGPRVQYDDGYLQAELFQPATLFIGVMASPALILPSDWKLTVDLAYQADKWMVPSPPDYAWDGAGGLTIVAGKDPDVSACRGMYQSFYDSPDGFKGEMDEIGHRVSVETRASHGNKLYFSLRYGHSWRPQSPGYASYGAGGASLGLFGFHLDFYKILDTPSNPDGWHKNLGFTLGFRGNLSGKMFTF